MTNIAACNRSLKSSAYVMFLHQLLKKAYNKKLQPSLEESGDRCSCRQQEIEKQQGCSALKFDLMQFYQTSSKKLQNENIFLMK